MTSSYYFRFLSYAPNRLDENYNSPKYEEIGSMLKKSRFRKIVELGNESSEDKLILRLTSGKTPSGIEYIEDGVPFIGASNVSNYQIDVKSAPKISLEEHNTRLSSSKVRNDDVVISMAGTVGHCALYEEDEECNCNQAIAILEIDPAKILPEYLVYYLNSQIGQLFFGKLQHESDQPNINLDEIKKIDIVLPDKDAQKNLIDKCRPINSKHLQKQKEADTLTKNLDTPFRKVLNSHASSYDQLFKSNYYSLFAKNINPRSDRFDFVGNHPIFDWIRRFRNNSAGTINLGSLIDEDTFGYGISKSALEIGAIGFLNVQHLNLQGSVVFEPKTFVSECSDDKKLKENDILIARTGHTLGKAAFITEDYSDFAFGSFCIRFSIISDDYLPEFIAYFINSIYGQAQIMILKTGSGKNNINKEQIADIRIPKINKTIQIEILKQYKKNLDTLSDLKHEDDDLVKEMNSLFTQTLFEI